MKSCFLAPMILTSALSALHGESSFEQDYAQLKEQRQTALIAAALPIDAKYQEMLEDLLKKAIQSGDLDAAIKIKAAIKALLLANAPQEPIETVLMRSTWGWHPNKADAPAYGTVKFLEKGKLSPSGSIGWLTKWEVVGKNRFKMFNGGDTAYWLFEYFPEKEQAITQPDPKSIGDTKFLIPAAK